MLITSQFLFFLSFVILNSHFLVPFSCEILFICCFKDSLYDLALASRNKICERHKDR